ncbi:MAG: hypothetical protein ACI82Q_000672 [Nonlabens sp.]|jgi:hypothetical protein
MKKSLLLIVLLLLGFFLQSQSEKVNQEKHYKTETAQGK